MNNPINSYDFNEAVTEALNNLNLPYPNSMVDLFSYISDISPSATLRDIEPLVGYFVLYNKSERLMIAYMEMLYSYIKVNLWDNVRRGGYILDVCLTYNNNFTAYDYRELCAINERLPTAHTKIPYFPQDKRQTVLDDLVNKWQLSSGILYDRLNRMMKYPHIC